MPFLDWSMGRMLLKLRYNVGCLILPAVTAGISYEIDQIVLLNKLNKLGSLNRIPNSIDCKAHEHLILYLYDSSIRDKITIQIYNAIRIYVNALYKVPIDTFY